VKSLQVTGLQPLNLTLTIPVERAQALIKTAKWEALPPIARITLQPLDEEEGFDWGQPTSHTTWVAPLMVISIMVVGAVLAYRFRARVLPCLKRSQSEQEMDFPGEFPVVTTGFNWSPKSPRPPRPVVHFRAQPEIIHLGLDREDSGDELLVTARVHPPTGPVARQQFEEDMDVDN
jgi:hypothetical protein